MSRYLILCFISSHSFVYGYFLLVTQYALLLFSLKHGEFTTSSLTPLIKRRYTYKYIMMCVGEISERFIYPQHHLEHNNTDACDICFLSSTMLTILHYY